MISKKCSCQIGKGGLGEWACYREPSPSSKCFTFCTKNMLSPIVKVHAQEPFPFDLAFAMTVHKAQGRTIKRVGVDLTHHPRYCCCMKHAAIFVAMSWVAETDHIRLSEPDTICQRESLCSCLSSIPPQKHIAPFLHGYSEDGLPWNPQQALQFSSKLNMSQLQSSCVSLHTQNEFSSGDLQLRCLNNICRASI